ncbi:MAG TPA: peptidoglycan-binding protein [Longimicrobiaceae bacterium]|nr:peptidoglycan-binding protein [Longimicrobiaceae bacterium]
MRTTRQLREVWAPACNVPLTSRTLVPGVRVQVHARTIEAVQALGSVFQAHRYHVRQGDTGAYNCRRITGGTGFSLHAYGIAIDVNWNSNPFRERLVTDMPPEMIQDVYRIRTFQDLPVWRWGGDWDKNPATEHTSYDAMHFEVVASPQELASGIAWSTVAQPPRDRARPDTWPTLHPGDRGPTVVTLQQLLSLPADGVFGNGTAAAVRAYQQSHGLTADGIVGLASWTALLTGQPPVGPDVPSPVKLPVQP